MASRYSVLDILMAPSHPQAAVPQYCNDDTAQRRIPLLQMPGMSDSAIWVVNQSVSPIGYFAPLCLWATQGAAEG